jgi:hypothetical protein
MRFVVASLVGLLAASCGPVGHDPDPGGLTASEARALDDAAEMLQERRLPSGAQGNAQDGITETPVVGPMEAKPDA